MFKLKMCNKKKCLLLFIFIFVLPISYASIVVNPSSWELNVNAGTNTSKTFVFSQNTDNTTSSLAFSKSGTNSDWLSFNAATASISNSNGTLNNFTLTASIAVPSSAISGTFLIKLKYDGSEIPVVLTVKENTTTDVVSIGNCRLEPFPDTYSIPIVAGSPPLTQQFSVLISKRCTEEVNIKTPVITGNTQTKNGLRPLNLIGGSKLGFTEPNSEGVFDIQIDTSGLPSGTYKPQILLTGIYKGEQLSSKISFTVEVRQGATPLESSFSLPSYILSSSDLALNNTYTITAQNLNPNFQPFIEQNGYIRGIKVDTSNGWVFSFQPIKIGTTKLRIGTYFAGAPIGDLSEKEIRISYGSATSIGSGMCFQFFTPGNKALDSLSNGDKITVIIRTTEDKDILCSSNNSKSTIVSDAVLYKNGIKLSSNEFNVNAGEIITLSASVPGFTSIDKVLDVPLNPVQLSFQTPNNEIEVNVPFLIVTDPADATITINGQETPSRNQTFSNEGVVNIIVSKPGYKQTSIDATITPQLKIMTTDIPKKIKIDEPYSIELNKPATWKVYYQESEKNASVFHFKEATSKNIEFVPDRKGIYKVYLRNDLLNTYKIGGLSLPVYFWWILGGLIVIFFIINIISSKGGSSSGKNTGGAKFEFNVDDFNQ